MDEPVEPIETFGSYFKDFLVYADWHCPSGIVPALLLTWFAIHQDPKPDRRRRADLCWVVSHRETGAAIVRNLKLTQAISLAWVLANRPWPEGWDFRTEAEFNGLRNRLRMRLVNALEALGIFNGRIL